jgi:hypothetical protein
MIFSTEGNKEWKKLRSLRLLLWVFPKRRHRSRSPKYCAFLQLKICVYLCPSAVKNLRASAIKSSHVAEAARRASAVAP